MNEDAVKRVYECLIGAQSIQPDIQKNSEIILKNLEKQQWFCYSLVEIIRSNEAEYGARWLAAIHLKNMVTRNWKDRVGKLCFKYFINKLMFYKCVKLREMCRSITVDEKKYLKNSFLLLVGQENQQLAVPIAVSIAKIARYDYPVTWSSLFSDLINLIRGKDALLIHRAFLVLHHVIKELSTMRLPNDKKTFNQVSSELYPMYFQSWKQDTEKIIQELQDEFGCEKNFITSHNFLILFERWFFEFKFSSACLSCVQTLYSIYLSIKIDPASQVKVFLNNALVKVAKCLVHLLDAHPWSIYHSGVLGQSIEFYSAILTQPLDSSLAKSFAPQMFAFLKLSASCEVYWSGTSSNIYIVQNVDKSNLSKNMAIDVRQKLKSFFNGEDGKKLIVSLIDNYLPLNDVELLEFEMEPENFHLQSGSAQDDQLRNAVQSLLSALMDASDLLPTIIMEKLTTLAQLLPPNFDISSLDYNVDALVKIPKVVRAKEAVYTAARIGAWQLMDIIDVSTWIKTVLIPETADRRLINKPVRRSIGYLLGAWIPKIGNEDRVLVYQTLVDMMMDIDVAIALGGCCSLRDVINDWDFSEEIFQSFLKPTFLASAKILQVVVDYQSQIQVFNLLNVILERVGNCVQHGLSDILALLPKVWENAGDSTLLKMQDANLLEDALDLYLVTLRNAPDGSYHLLSFFPSVLQIMSTSTEHMVVCSNVTKSCLLLGGGSHFLASFGINLASTLCDSVSTLSEKGVRVILPILELITQYVPRDGPVLVSNYMLEALLIDMFERQSDSTIAASINVFTRLLFLDHAQFFEFFNRVNRFNMSDKNGLERFAEVWLDKVDILPNIRSRKMSGLAMCTLLSHSHLHSFIMSHLLNIMSHITSVWMESECDPSANELIFGDYIKFLHPNSSHVDSNEAAIESEEAEAEYSRILTMRQTDPVVTLQISQVLKSILKPLMLKTGPGSLSQALNSIDTTIKSQIEVMLQ